jgi:hypothetical protein
MKVQYCLDYGQKILKNVCTSINAEY